MSALAINNFSLLACGILTLAAPLLPTFSLQMTYAALFGFIICKFPIVDHKSPKDWFGNSLFSGLRVSDVDCAVRLARVGEADKFVRSPGCC